MKTQQRACYAAEEKLERGDKFATVVAAQKFVDDLRDTRWWYAQGFALAVPRIEVGAAKGARSVGWFDKEKNGGRIELTAQGLCTRVVLHEMAHVLSVAQHGSKSHDPWWARLYLTLVSCVMGSDAYLTLQRAFDEHSVDYDVKTSPSHTIAL